jgi:hypothetical protein
MQDIDLLSGPYPVCCSTSYTLTEIHFFSSEHLMRSLKFLIQLNHLIIKVLSGKEIF